MILVDPRFQIDITEERSRPLVPAPHPIPPQNPQNERIQADSAASDFFNSLLGGDNGLSAAISALTNASSVPVTTMPTRGGRGGKHVS